MKTFYILSLTHFNFFDPHKYLHGATLTGAANVRNRVAIYSYIRGRFP